MYDHHKWVHDRLLNWARWVTPGMSPKVSPMFRDYRSHAWQWHPREHRLACDPIEAQQIERIIAKLPHAHRESLRWCYVYQSRVSKACRTIGAAPPALMTYIHDGRGMVDLALRGGRWEVMMAERKERWNI
ncbi:MAG: hypothetical protein CGW95_04885 [Phenylobacterium zucineum]|nr:MAG: hypothetical protein CGW95_04885 [Phenylobacterium zucineum]